MVRVDPEELLKIVGATAAILTFLANAAAVVVNAAVSVRNQRSAVILHCSLRYDALYADRAEIDERPTAKSRPPMSKAPPKTQAFFHRYFGLESDQIDFWLAGYVDPETLSSWLVSLVDNLYKKSVDGYSFVEGWNHLSDHHKIVNPTLYSFIRKFLEEKTNIERYPAKDEEIYSRIVSFMEQTELNQLKIRRKLRKRFSAGFSSRELTLTLPPTLKNRVKQLRANMSRP